MGRQLWALTVGNLRMIVRDRILHGVFGVAAVMLLLVPTLSTFSMRQVQELAITLTLSAISLALLVVALLLGATSLWRDVERRYTAAILTQPLGRSTYVLAKFAAIALFLLACALILGLAGAIVIPLAAAEYPSDLPLLWQNIALAIAADSVKYILLAAIGILLSSVSTSFFLPFFGTLAIYLAGSGSQEVYEYVSGDFGQRLSPLLLSIIKSAYYLLPNFAAFNFKVQAVYALPVSGQNLLLSLAYSVCATIIILSLAIFAFNRRELP